MAFTQPLTAHEMEGPWRVVRHEASSDTDGRPPVAPSAGWIDAAVPGAVQYDLIRAGKLDNPFASSEAVRKAEWVHDADWLYSHAFDFPLASVGQGVAYLEIDGVDTFADVWLNGAYLGSTANAYRSYRFEIAEGTLRATGNELLVHVKAHKRMVDPMVDEARRRLGPTFKYKGLIRRYQRSFFAGSSLLNLGGEVLGIGIYKPMRIVVLPSTRLEDAHFVTLCADADSAQTEVAVELNQTPSGWSSVRARLLDPETGAEAARSERAVDGASVTLSLDLERPKRWWPRGYGVPNRYGLEIELIVDGAVVSRAALRVGVRTSRIDTELPSGRSTFQLVVNDVLVDVRGHNLVPLDYIKVHAEREAYAEMMELVCDSHANLVRIWGGGAIEAQDFYELCDANGVMIWQDFYLHSTTYPDYDEAWVADYRRECEGVLRYLRNRPSLVVVCGGNELYEGWDEWGWRGQIDRFYGERLFTEVGKQVAESLTPELPYVLNSPHGGASCQTPGTGEVHNWGNFYNSTKDPLFVTETCWSQESYSRPETLEEVMDLDVDAYAGVGWPDAWRELTGLGLVTRMPYTGGPLVTDSLRSYIKSLEIEQAVADHHALSNLLVRSPSCHGLVYWPLNKGGPLFQFGAVDYGGFPLASFYAVKRLYRDAVISLYRDGDDIRIVGVNRGRVPLRADLRVTHERIDGTLLQEWSTAVVLEAGGRARLRDLDGAYRLVIDRHREVIRAQLVVDGETVSEEALFFCPLMEFSTEDVLPTATVRKLEDGRWDVDLRSDRLVKMLYVESDGKVLLDDNYFTLSPHSARTLGARRLGLSGPEPTVLRVHAMDTNVVLELPLS